MSDRLVGKLLTKDHGESNPLCCPVCKKQVAMRLFEDCDYSVSALLLKKEHGFFAVCPQCATVFSVNPNYVKEKSRGTVCTLEENDLAVMVNGHG